MGRQTGIAWAPAISRCAAPSFVPTSTSRTRVPSTTYDGIFPTRRIHFSRVGGRLSTYVGNRREFASSQFCFANHPRVFQAWRPIKPVYKDPLAVADATTVAEADLIPARIIFEDHERESWTVKHSPSHRWYFKYGQQPDEVLLIKCFDSREDVARRAPHSAFQNPRHVDEPWRESIEIRTMVFYGDQ